MQPNTEERFWSLVWKTGEHWRWFGSGKKFILDGYHHYPHRLAWILTKGPLPDRKPIVQQCDERGCINPEHYAPSGSLHPIAIARFWEKVNKNGQVIRPELGPCWEWTACLGRHGYGSVGWFGHNELAHRVAWFLTHGEFPELWLLHRCDNRKCVRDEHVYEGTVIENHADKMSRGRFDSKLSAEDVGAIRKLYLEGVRISILSRQFGVAWHAIDRIVCGKRWAHLTGGVSVHNKSEPLKGSQIHHLAKLREADIPAIRRLYRHGARQASIADEFGVTQSVISKVVLRQTWKHVTD